MEKWCAALLPPALSRAAAASRAATCALARRLASPRPLPTPRITHSTPPRSTGTTLEYNLDCVFERHNTFLTSTKLTALLRPTAATSPDVAVAPVAIALLPTGGLAYHPSQYTTTTQLPASTLPLSLSAAPPTAPPVPDPTTTNSASLTHLPPPPTRICRPRKPFRTRSTTHLHTT